jgi:hypothetical protein
LSHSILSRFSFFYVNPMACHLEKRKTRKREEEFRETEKKEDFESPLNLYFIFFMSYIYVTMVLPSAVMSVLCLCLMLCC